MTLVNNLLFMYYHVKKLKLLVERIVSRVKSAMISVKNLNP